MVFTFERPVDTGRKWNVHKTLRRCPGRLLNVLCTFNLRPVSTGERTSKMESKTFTSVKSVKSNHLQRYSLT